MSTTPAQVYLFGDCELNVNLRSVTCAGEPVQLKPKTFDILLYLLEHSDRVATKEELLSSIWPESFVEESNLSQHVFLLRKALAKSNLGDNFILTIPGRGYRIGSAVQRSQITPAREPLQHSARSHPPAEMAVQHAISITRLVAEEEIINDQPSSSLRLTGASARGRSWPFWTIAALAILAAFFAFRASTRQWRISDYRQITHDGNKKYMGSSDGSRIYFSSESARSIQQISTSGGLAFPLDIPPDYQWAGDLSPDGSKLLVLSELGGMGAGSSVWTYQILGGNLHRIANAISATWSPDGEKIAYATNTGDIFLCQSNGSNPQKLLSAGGYIRSLAWSPDGRLLRFSKDGRLWQIAADGSNYTELLPGWAPSASQSAGQWARDGRYFFISNGQIWMLEEHRFLSKIRPPRLVQLTSGPTLWDHPSPTPDGRKLFASGQTRRGELIRLDSRQKEFHSFLNGISAEFLDYSRDGKNLAYVTFPEGILWRSIPDGSHPLQLTSPPVYPKSIRWSPDGRQILFVDTNSNGTSCLYLLPADGSQTPKRLLPIDQQAENDPSWSPDGSQIVFSTTQYVGVSASSELHILDINTGKLTTLPNSSGLTVPRWSPDGKFIAAMTLDTLGMKLFTLATQQWTTLDPGSVAFPEWSRDSRSLYYIDWRGDGTLVRLNPFTGHKDLLASLNGDRFTGFYTSWMGLDPSDAPLMLRDIGRTDLYALSLTKN